MPKKSPEDLTKVTLNLFTADVADFKRRYGFGWSEQMRLVIRNNCKLDQRLKRGFMKSDVQILSEDMVDGDEA